MIDTSWMRVWWIVYNKRLFDDTLTMPKFLAVELKHCGEFYQDTITLSTKLTDRDEAKATLLHEMVHQWQAANSLPLDHGHKFAGWRDRILAATNLEI